MMYYRRAELSDALTLAEMNRQLIVDEGHRNSMTVHELEGRMKDWLQNDYEAYLFTSGEDMVGYALYRREPDWVYLRQFYIDISSRRQGIGRDALNYMMDSVWNDARRIRLDVLSTNSCGIAFWKAAGFRDYCVTMECER
ncbi:MAG: GNAT family N-acetyltransferase [Candidatus Hydrogenedentes bacterium]|nr:GNAT family N-acetyltransferase [Candidatus Hydrogenedentota bacterium]